MRFPRGTNKVTNITRLVSAVALAGGLTLSASSAANAQGAPPAPPAAAADQRQWDAAQMRARFDERRQHRQQVLHDALGLRADQEGAWQAFIASSGRPEGQRGPGMRREDGDKAELTTPQRLDRMQERMAERQARFAQRAEAIKRFYAALDARQQKTFDALIMNERDMMGGMGGMRGMGRMGHGGPVGPMRGQSPG